MSAPMVTVRVQVYERDGEDVPAGVWGKTILRVESHWNSTDRIVLTTPRGETFTVLARDLEDAANRARKPR